MTGNAGWKNGRNTLTAHNQLSHNQFAHYQFAAQNFKGLNNFSKTGFNRNAFGNNASWNHWGGHFWGAGWDHWGWGWGCWAGPVFWPAQRIEQVVQPTAQQQSAFDDLKKAAQKAGDQLQSSCPTAVPKSPVARVDTVETRLTAMADAIKSVRPDLQNFYASLSDEQKAKFNTIGPPPKDSSSLQQRQGGG